MNTTSTWINPKAMFKPEILWKEFKNFRLSSFSKKIKDFLITVQSTIKYLHCKSHQSPTFRTNICTTAKRKRDIGRSLSWFEERRCSMTLPTTKSNVIIISHIDIKDKFTFNRIELCWCKHFVIFWLRKTNDRSKRFEWRRRKEILSLNKQLQYQFYVDTFWSNLFQIPNDSKMKDIVDKHHFLM